MIADLIRAIGLQTLGQFHMQKPNSGSVVSRTSIHGQVDARRGVY